ncbi:MAG: hypothetical protein J7L35_10540 [Anaerolineales bacterium]|nr:hypothetical protein [Anaerolineales bacterium]
MDKKEINPLLRKELEHLKDVPERGLQASHAGRENYLSQIRTMKPRPVQAKKSVQAGRRRSWALRMASVIAVLALALGSIGGTVYAAQASGPDDLLYGVKTLTEDIQVGLKSDPQDRLDLYTQFASRRLTEIQAQVDAGEEVSEKALALLEKHTQKMLEEAAKMGEQGIGSALSQIEQNLQKQNQMMEEMGKQHPQGSPPGLLKAQEKIRERLELVENGMNEPQGFRETIKEQKEKSDNPGQSKKDGSDNSNKPETPPGQEDKDTPNNGQGNGKDNGNGNEDLEAIPTDTP